MKVAIIAPPYPLKEAPAPPLGVTYVAAAFEAAGAEVRIFDYIVSRYSPEKLQAQMESFRPDAIGSTSVTLNFPGAADIVRTAKRINPDVVTMMGGPHVSFDAVNTLSTYPEIDLLVIGEGERTIAELTPRLKTPKVWEKIKGIAFHENGAIRMTEPQDWIEDLDTLPHPARHLLPMSRYQALGYPVSMITSRGCPYSCIFCLGRRMVGSKVRQRSAQLVVDEIEHILSYGITRINVADDLFVSHKGKVREVCTEIKRRGLNFAWSAFARVNTVDRETLEIMKDAGCDAVSFGVESGNEEMLKRIKKGITLDQARKAVQLCRDVDIHAHTSFVVGLPGETPESIEDTRRVAEELNGLYGYHILAPFPGTTVREEIDKYDLEILSDDWTRYDANSAIVRTSKMSQDAINAFVGEYDQVAEDRWQEQIKSYHDGTCSPYEKLLVAGYFRTQLVYKLLSQDLIETSGPFPAELDVEGSIEALSAWIRNASGVNGDVADKTIRDFVDKGYIRSRKSGKQLIWHWTHNNRVDEF